MRFSNPEELPAYASHPALTLMVRYLSERSAQKRILLRAVSIEAGPVSGLVVIDKRVGWTPGKSWTIWVLLHKRLHIHFHDCGDEERS